MLMPLYSGDALVLRTYRLAEADRIVVFLTRDRGKRRGVAKGARRARSRFAGALEPLTRASVAYFEKEQRQLVRLNYVEVQHSPLASHSGEALGHVGYFAELLDECAAEADPNETLFRLAAAVGETLIVTSRVDRLARYFEYWLLRLQGVYPSIDACAACGAALGEGARLLPGERVFVCRECGRTRGGQGLGRAAVAFLRRAKAVRPDELEDVEVPSTAIRELELVHETLITTHLEKELKSVRVLRVLRT